MDRRRRPAVQVAARKIIPSARSAHERQMRPKDAGDVAGCRPVAGHQAGREQRRRSLATMRSKRASQTAPGRRFPSPRSAPRPAGSPVRRPSTGFVDVLFEAAQGVADAQQGQSARAVARTAPGGGSGRAKALATANKREQAAKALSNEEQHEHDPHRPAGTSTLQQVQSARSRRRSRARRRSARPARPRAPCGARHRRGKAPPGAGFRRFSTAEAAGKAVRDGP